MERTQHYILNYLDEPIRIFFFTILEIVVMLGCFFGCLWMDHFGLGVILAFAGVLGLRKLQDFFKISSFSQLSYWFLPDMERHMRFKIPSHIREFVS